MKESRYLSGNQENIDKLAGIPTMKHFHSDQLITILRQSKIRQYADGECIIEEGELDPWLFVLLSGTVALQKQGVDIGEIGDMGEVMGEMSLIDGTPRSTTIRSRGPVTCLALDTSASNDAVTPAEKKEYFVILYRVFLKTMSARLRERTAEIASLKTENQRLRAELGK